MNIFNYKLILPFIPRTNRMAYRFHKFRRYIGCYSSDEYYRCCSCCLVTVYCDRNKYCCCDCPKEVYICPPLVGLCSRGYHAYRGSPCCCMISSKNDTKFCLCCPCLPCLLCFGKTRNQFFDGWICTPFICCTLEPVFRNLNEEEKRNLSLYQRYYAEKGRYKIETKTKIQFPCCSSYITKFEGPILQTMTIDALIGDPQSSMEKELYQCMKQKMYDTRNEPMIADIIMSYHTIPPMSKDC